MTLTKPIWTSIATPLAIAGMTHPCSVAAVQCTSTRAATAASAFAPAPRVETIPMGPLPRAGFHVLDLQMMTDAFLHGVRGLAIEHPDVIARRYRLMHSMAGEQFLTRIP